MYINGNCNRGYSNPHSYYRSGTYNYGNWLTGTSGGSQWNLDSLEVFYMTNEEHTPCANVECPTSFCTPENVCQLGACAPTTRPDGTLCDDGDDTTAFDACYAGACIGAQHHSNTTSYELPELHPGRAYSVQVQAYNGVGGGPISDAVYGETLEAPPSQSAVDVQAEALSATRVRLTWGEPPLDTHNGLLLGYQLFAANGSDSGGKETGVRLLQTLSLQHTALTLPAAPYTNYTWFIVAYNGAGASPPAAVSIVTPQARPGRPTRARAAVEWDGSSGTKTLRVTWQPPQEPNGVITNYTVSYQE